MNEKKPTKYFCSLESRNYISKQIPRIEKKNGLIICKQEEILEELNQFYETFYKKPAVIENENFCNNLDKYSDILKFTQDESQSITEKEVLEFLLKMKNVKTPGPQQMVSHVNFINSSGKILVLLLPEQLIIPMRNILFLNVTS
jgi:hypothetical protein